MYGPGRSLRATTQISKSPTTFTIPPAGTITFTAGGQNYATLAAYQTAFGREQNIKNTNPLLVAPASGDFRLSSTSSSAFDAGTSTLVNNEPAMLNLDFIKPTKVATPQGAARYIGAFEFPVSPPSLSGLTATAASSSAINLNWTDNSGNETGFEVDRALNNAFSSGLVMTNTGANPAMPVSVGSLNAGITYFFRVRATNAVGDSTIYPLTGGMSATTQAGGNTNLAPNPGFEIDPNVDYATNGTATYTWATDFSHGGSRSIKNVSTQPAGTLTRWFSLTNEIAVTPGSSYTTSVWFKTTSVTDHALLKVNFWDANQAVIFSNSASSTNLTGTANWTQRTVTATAPVNAAYMRVEFQLYGPGTPGPMT